MAWGHTKSNRVKSSLIDQMKFLQRQTLSLTLLDSGSATEAYWDSMRNKGACHHCIPVILTGLGLVAVTWPDIVSIGQCCTGHGSDALALRMLQLIIFHASHPIHGYYRDCWMVRYKLIPCFILLNFTFRYLVNAEPYDFLQTDIHPINNQLNN